MSEVLANDHQLVLKEIDHEEKAWWPPEPLQPSGGSKADVAAVAAAAAAATAGGGGSPVAAKDDPKYAKFLKMLKMGLPRGAVEIKIVAEGRRTRRFDSRVHMCHVAKTDDVERVSKMAPQISKHISK